MGPWQKQLVVLSHLLVRASIVVELLAGPSTKPGVHKGQHFSHETSTRACVQLLDRVLVPSSLCGLQPGVLGGLQLGLAPARPSNQPEELGFPARGAATPSGLLGLTRERERNFHLV